MGKTFGVTIDRDITVGDYLVPDGWRGLGGILLQGDGYVDHSYPGSQFRVHGVYAQCPVNVTPSGRTMQYGRFSSPAMRVRIEWVQDGEPNTISHGWVVFNH